MNEGIPMKGHTGWKCASCSLERYKQITIERIERT